MKQWTMILTAVWSFAMEAVSFKSPPDRSASIDQVDQKSPSNVDLPLLETLTTYEVFQPRQYEDYQHKRRKSSISTKIRNAKGLHAEKAYFAFEFEGKTYKLDVYINLVLLPKSFFIDHISETGTSRIHKPTVHEQNHCYYQGEIRDVPDSRVILSTCRGIKGCIILPDDFLIFEPLSDTTTELYQDTPHVIYRSKDVISNKPNGTCEQNGSQSDLHSFVNNLESHSAEFSNEVTSRKKRNATLRKRFVELLLVVDFALATKLGNLTAIESHVKEIANYIDGIYQILGTGIRVVLSGVEVWSSADRINVSSIAHDTLGNLIALRRSQSSSQPPTSAWVYADTVQLLHGGSFNGSTVGLALVGTMCTTRSCGVNEDPSNDVLHIASIVAHEMGHNLGLFHDNNKCSCPADADCIMTASIGPDTNTKKDWSNCSRSYLEQNRQSVSQSCLYNVPSPSRVYLGPECGNDIVEGNEECDCGTPEFCKSRCCNASTCKLLPEAACDYGTCCSGCQYVSAGTECRGTNGDGCDFPEYCTGQSADCPDDIHLLNGISCRDNSAHCIDGVCLTRDSQCHAIWGPTARALPICYNLNSLGNANGNCGQAAGMFLRCSVETLLCGKLFCSGGAPNPLSNDITFFILTSIRTSSALFQCKTPASFLGVTNNRFLVKTGTKCGPGKMCSQGGCFRLRPNTCSSVTCNGNGKCDNLGHCHCNAGFLPPHCKAKSNGGNVVTGGAGSGDSAGNTTDVFDEAFTDNTTDVSTENGTEKTTDVLKEDSTERTTDVFIKNGPDNTTGVFTEESTESTTIMFSEGGANDTTVVFNEEGADNDNDTGDEENNEASATFDWRLATIISALVIMGSALVGGVVALMYPHVKAWKGKRAIQCLNVKSWMTKEPTKFDSAILKKVDS